MKAKIYPITNLKKVVLPPDIKGLHLQIICASLAKGSSVISNVALGEHIKTTIKWCQQIGATIKYNKGKLYIKGINNKINIKDNIFSCDNSYLTINYMLPILSLAKTNLILKASKDVINSCDPYMYIFEKQNVIYIKEDNSIRLESDLKSGIIYIDGKNNNSLIIGLFLALPLLNLQSKLIVRAPIEYASDLDYAISILKTFGIIINKSNDTTYEIKQKQSYRGKNIKTDADYRYLTAISLIGSLKGEILINGINKKSLQNDFKIYNFLKSSNFNLNHKVIKRKEYYIKNIDSSMFENFIPLLMILALRNKEKTIIKNLDMTNSIFLNQLHTMLDNFKELGIEYDLVEDELTIIPKKKLPKKQLNTNNDPYVALALSTLAMVNNEPLILYDCNCIEIVYENFYDYLKQNNVKIEFIHN